MKVKAGSVYTFRASIWDIIDRNFNTPHEGQLVRVVNLPGCPQANCMGHCHVETPGGEFIGLVACASLHPVKETIKAAVKNSVLSA
jgi:hypothetical protein